MPRKKYILKRLRNGIIARYIANYYGKSRWEYDTDLFQDDIDLLPPELLKDRNWKEVHIKMVKME